MRSISASIKVPTSAQTGSSMAPSSLASSFGSMSTTTLPRGAAEVLRVVAGGHEVEARTETEEDIRGLQGEVRPRGASEPGLPT